MMYRPETRSRTATGTLVVEPSAGATAEDKSPAVQSSVGLSADVPP